MTFLLKEMFILREKMTGFVLVMDMTLSAGFLVMILLAVEMVMIL